MEQTTNLEQLKKKASSNVVANLKHCEPDSLTEKRILEYATELKLIDSMMTIFDLWMMLANSINEDYANSICGKSDDITDYVEYDADKEYEELLVKRNIVIDAMQVRYEAQLDKAHLGHMSVHYCRRLDLNHKAKVEVVNNVQFEYQLRLFARMYFDDAEVDKMLGLYMCNNHFDQEDIELYLDGCSIDSLARRHGLTRAVAEKSLRHEMQTNRTWKYVFGSRSELDRLRDEFNAYMKDPKNYKPYAEIVKQRGNLIAIEGDTEFWGCVVTLMDADHVSYDARNNPDVEIEKTRWIIRGLSAITQGAAPLTLESLTVEEIAEAYSITESFAQEFYNDIHDKEVK